MNRDQFHQYLGFPDRLDAVSLAELEDLVGEYPYFQAARMLYVKNLKNLDNIKFNRQLRFAAAHVNNRQFLFGLLNGISISEDGSFMPQMPVKDDLIAEIPDFTSTDLLALSTDEQEEYLPDDSSAEMPDNKSIYLRELEKFIPIADMDLLLFDFQADDQETLEFDFEGRLPEIPPAKKPKEQLPDNLAPVKVSSRDLIDEFIRKNPRMPKPAETDLDGKDLSSGSTRESDAFMTETLAEIYMKQGYYYKALNTYEKLSLKYPEKSIYFASQIKIIKELISNQ